MSGGDTTGTDRDLWPPHHAFAVGELVARRYRVDRLLGRGAMGEVYAVHDEELGSDVALKLLKIEAHADAESRERFKREILLARRVSHPNVCRIYDFGLHEPEPDAVAEAAPRHGPLRFLTMELLVGETLVERLERVGPLPEAEAIAIARQLAAALDAAHAAGVVHRDFKSSNVMLVGERAVVTDFGLAREATTLELDRLTMTGGVLGTPAYMAPEQVEGRPIDARTDIYALGIVLYEMLTARFPFEGDSPLAVALKRVREPPAPPEHYRPGLSPALRGALRRALARRPEDRFASAGELAAALTVEGAGSRSPRQQSLRIAALAVSAALLGGLGWLALRPRGPRPAAASAETVATRTARPVVGVLPLRNATGRDESAWLSTALAEMLTSELAEGERLRTVPGDSVARAARDLALTTSDALDRETIARLDRGLGSQIFLTGSYVALGEPGAAKLRLDLRLQFADERPDATRSVVGDEAELFALVARAGGDLRAALGLPEAPSSGAAAATQPRDERARQLYALGLEKLRGGEPAVARELFESALAEDREAPLAWSALAEAWSLLGWSDRSREAAREAFDRRAALPRAEALEVEGRYRLASAEWDAAIDIQRALWRLYGDDPEQGLRLVHALLEADRGRDAEAVIAELWALPEPAASDPRIDLAAARAADGLSEPRRQLEAAERAESKARAAGARSFIARALYEQGLARRKLGEPAAARQALEASRRLAAELFDRNGDATAAMALANQARAEGRLDEAAALFGEARATFAALGNRQREARAELSLGLVRSQKGDVAGALALYRTAQAKLREVGDRRGSAVALANIGSLLYERGDLAGAQARHEESLGEFRQIGDDSRAAVSLQNLAQIRVDRGDLAGAGRDLEEELTLARRIEDRTAEGYALKALADLAVERGEIEEAEKRYREAQSTFAAAGQASWALYARQGLAVLDRVRGRAAQAVPELERLEAEYAAAGMSDDRDEAALELWRARLAAGQTADGADELVARAAQSDVQRLRLLAGWVAAGVAEARGDFAESDRRLAENEATSGRAGLVLANLEARVERCRLAARGGDPAAATRAAQLAREAERLGAGRLAARARAVAAG